MDIKQEINVVKPLKAYVLPVKDYILTLSEFNDWGYILDKTEKPSYDQDYIKYIENMPESHMNLTKIKANATEIDIEGYYTILSKGCSIGVIDLKEKSTLDDYSYILIIEDEDSKGNKIYFTLSDQFNLNQDKYKMIGYDLYLIPVYTS